MDGVTILNPKLPRTALHMTYRQGIQNSTTDCAYQLWRVTTNHVMSVIWPPGKHWDWPREALLFRGTLVKKHRPREVPHPSVTMITSLSALAREPCAPVNIVSFEKLRALGIHVPPPLYLKWRLGYYKLKYKSPQYTLKVRIEIYRQVLSSRRIYHQGPSQCNDGL